MTKIMFLFWFVPDVFILLTSGVRERLLPPVQTWSSFQTWVLRSTSWTYKEKEANVKIKVCSRWAVIDKRPVPTGGQRDSLPQCPGSHVGYQLSGTVQTCGWSPCPEPSQTHPGLPSPCHPRYKKRLLNYLSSNMSITWSSPQGLQLPHYLK